MRFDILSAVALAAGSITLLASQSGTSGAAQNGPPTWAYGTDPAKAAAGRAANSSPARDQSPRRLTGSEFAFTYSQIQDRFGPADWFPSDHPRMPEIVAQGRKPEVWACSLCHYPNGKGRPENAGVSGLPNDYFVEQMNAFREGARKSADTRKQNTNVMIAIAKGMTAEEIKQAAEYFGSMRWTPWIKVVETKMVPQTRTSVGMYLPIEDGGKEPIGRRIIEVPVDVEATETLRNPRSGFIAYVPPGSIRAGEQLVVGRTTKTSACGPCHGTDLMGLGPIPGIAGRSPSYLVRQLYDMQQGTRQGRWTELMKPVVSRLSEEDMLNIAAYASSRTP